MILQLILCGAIIGIANILPGMSGGTMAVILNIYDQLIDAISNWRKDFLGSVRFLAPILVGAGIAIVLTSNFISYLLETQYVLVNFFFVGVILGSIPMIWREIMKEKYTVKNLIVIMIAFQIMIMTSRISGGESTDAIITTLTADVCFKLVISSAVAAFCMIIPGISGSFVMLLLGVYGTVVAAIKDFNILLLMPIGIGVLLGLLGGAKGIDYLLRQCKSLVYSAILGLVAGSVYVMVRQIIQSGEIAQSMTSFIGYALIFVVGCCMTLVFDSPKFKKFFARKS